jgi:vitamin B12 transporter
MFRSVSERILFTVLALVGGLTPLSAQASPQPQTPAPAPASPAESGQSAPDDPNPQFFDTVVVTAGRASQTTREVPTNVTIIDSNGINASTAQTVGDLLVQNGFNSTSYNDTSGVQIRGFGQLSGPPEYTNTVLILLNGRRTGNANLTLTGLKNVERIEIIRGPWAVQYGSSAMGGVINIITRQGSAAPDASLELGLGTDDLKRQKFAFSGAAKGFDVALGVSNYSRGDLTTSGDREWYHSATDNNTNVNVDLGYAINANNRVGLGYNFGDIKSQLSGSTGGIRPYSANTAAAPYTDYHTRTDNTAFLYSGSTPNKTWDWSASYSFGNYDQLPYKNFLDTKFFNTQAGYTRSRFSVSFGLDDYEYAPDPSNWRTRSVGVYGTGTLRLAHDRLMLSAGFRSDFYTNDSVGVAKTTDRHSGGSAGAAWLPQQWLKLRANYAEGFKMPAPPQVAGDGSIYYLPNPSLQPETSHTFEFGGDVDGRVLQASLTWFHSDWNDRIIAFVTPGACSGGFGCYQYQNLKTATLAGLEASFSADVPKASGKAYGLTPYVSLTWLPTRQNGDASQFIVHNGTAIDTLPNTPDWMVSYGIRYAEPRLKLSTALNASYYGDVLTQDWSVVDRVTVFTPPYIHRPTGTVFNLSADKEFASLHGAHNRLAVRAEVTNVFDAANEVYWGHPGPGRSVYVGLRYDY